jgi:hypothetical protein
MRRSHILVHATAGVAAVAAPGAGAKGSARDDGLPPSYAYTCGHLGVPCVGLEPPLRVRVKPRKAQAGRMTRFTVRVRRGSRPTLARVRLGGRTVRTDRRGRATLKVSLASGRRAVRAWSAPAERSVRAWVTVRR